MTRATSTWMPKALSRCRYCIATHPAAIRGSSACALGEFLWPHRRMRLQPSQDLTREAGRQAARNSRPSRFPCAGTNENEGCREWI